MIVRIATEAQFELNGGDAQELRELDQKAVEQCAAGDEEVFRTTFAQMLALIRITWARAPAGPAGAIGRILPPPDVSFEEAREGFSGEGLIPD